MLGRQFESYKYDMYTKSSGHDDSRWATDIEMKQNLRKIIISDNQYEQGGVPLISDGKTAYIDDSDAHTLILGATGSKKSRSICMPLLNILAKGEESFVVTDPKGELHEHISGLLHKNGYKVVVLNFRDPSYGDAWNPLSIPYQFYKSGNIDKAMETLSDIVHCIIQKSSRDPFWDYSAANFCFGMLQILLECASEEEVNVSSLTYLRTFAQEGGVNETTLSDFYGNLNKKTSAAISLSGTLNAAEATKYSILVTVDKNLQLFSCHRSLTEMLSYSTFDISRIGLEKTAVFLIMPDEKNTFHFLVSVFVKQCYESLIQVAQEQPGRKLPIRTNFVLDEFANIPPIPDMPAMITAARSRNVRFHLVVQSENQLHKMYDTDAHTIKGNCANWIFLTSKELALLEEISTLCGKRKVATGEQQEMLRPLISVSMLQRLNKERGEALVFYDRQYPYITQLADIGAYDFEQYASQPLVKRERRKIAIFSLEKYMKTHTDEEVAKLFYDDLMDEDEDNFDEAILDTDD